MSRPDGWRNPPAGSPEECRTHPGEWAINCRCCQADRKAAREVAAAVQTAHTARTTTEHVARIRAGLRNNREGV